MADFIPEPRDRLEAPICNAIESRDFKQALKLVEKRLAKSSDPYLLALKCFILCNHPLGTERAKAVGIILDLSKSSEGHFSAAELSLYDEGLRVQFLRRQGLEAGAICKMRADAVKAAPKDEQLARACFHACFKRGNLEYSQQIAVSLEKNFPANRAYQFWSITTTALYGMSSTCPSQKAQIYSRLAYTKIKALAILTLETTNTPSSRSLQSPQELLLFYRLLETHGNVAETAKFSEHELLGPTAKIAKDEWVFKKIALQLMESREDWQGLFNLSHTLLTMSRADQAGTLRDARGADWTVWKAYLKAASKLMSQEARDIVDKEISNHLDPKSGLDKTYRRNAWLANLEFKIFILPSPVSDLARDCNAGITELPERLTSLCLYLNQYGHNASAFDDIKVYVGNLRLGEQKDLLTALPWFLKHQMDGEENGSKNQDGQPFFGDQYAENWAARLPSSGGEYSWHDITSGITKSKLSYFSKSSLAERSRRNILRRRPSLKLKCDWCFKPCGIFCHSCLHSVARETLQAYRWAMAGNDDIAKNLKPTDKHPADEWASLTAVCLIKLALFRPFETRISRGEFSSLGIQQLLRAIVLLEYAHNHSKANPQISLLLTRLYALIGAGSLAMRAFHRLGLKQIQGDTLGYVLFDRISSLHPHVASNEGSDSLELLDPSKHLKKLQRLYRSFGNHISTNSWKSFEQESYDSVFQLMEVSDVLSRSMASAMFAIELRRVDRLTQPGAYQDRNSHGYDALPLYPATVEYNDNSDHASFPNYEDPEQAPFETYICTAPGPSNIRTTAFLLLEELWMTVLSTANSALIGNDAYVHLKNLKCETNRLSKIMSEQGDKVQSFTPAENYLVNIGLLLIHLVNEVCETSILDQGALFESALTICTAVNRRMLDITVMLEENIGEKHAHKWVPMFTTTLHPLYVAREAAELAIAVADCISRSPFSTPAGIESPIENMKGEAIKTRKLVSKKSGMVKRRVDHGRWLDFVLDQVQSDSPEKESPVNENESNVSEAPQTFSDLLIESISTEFLEQWAGELVDSWRDSVAGLDYLKLD